MVKPKKTRLHFGDLVGMIAEERPELTKHQISITLDSLFKLIPEKIYSGNDISIRRFGVFGLRHAKARKARKPNGPNDPSNVVEVPEKDVFKFWPNARLKNNLAYEVFVSSGEDSSEEEE
jgi:nucleoid DNA-binding protein